MHPLSDKVLCSVQVDAYRSGKNGGGDAQFSYKGKPDVVIFGVTRIMTSIRLKLKGSLSTSKNQKNLNIIEFIRNSHDDVPTLPIGLQNKVIGECDGVDGIYWPFGKHRFDLRRGNGKKMQRKIVGTDLCEETVKYIKSGSSSVLYQDLEMVGQKGNAHYIRIPLRSMRRRKNRPHNTSACYKQQRRLLL